jgi:murein DD-endopeptidase MepM/ murein hydrolase activator NlpD
MKMLTGLALALVFGFNVGATARAASEKQISAEVDAAVADLAARRNLNAQGKKLQELKAAAVPRLVYHLASTERRKRKVALCALHYCWSPLARAPLAKLLTDKDAEIRELAAGALAKRLKPPEVRKLLGPMVTDEEPYVARRMVNYLEQSAPDVARAGKCLQRSALHEAMARFLPRYESSQLSPATLKLTASSEKKVRHAAVAALTYQGPGSAESRKAVAKLLAHKDPVMRELAAEFLTWHGSSAEAPAIKTSAEGEKDSFALASMRAAGAAIERRKGRAPRPAPAPESFEPIWKYEGQSPAPGFQLARVGRLKEQARRLAIPLMPAMSEFEDASKAPPARSLVPPVRDYFDRARSSYGKFVGKGSKAFGNSIHVGDDVSWFRDGQAVVAIGDGVVRRAGCCHTWGYIVIVEHALADGSKFCSLYAHLGPFVQVKPGDIVKQGQKLGVVGRSLSWENGGYWAHLHFGIHKGAFLRQYPVGSEVPCTLSGKDYQAKVLECGPILATIEVTINAKKIRLGLRRRALWICGYISPASYKAGKHGWVDPQKFIRSKLAKPGV